SESPEEYLEKGMDTAMLQAGYRKIAQEHGMPIDTTERPRMMATVTACRAIVATRLNAPDLERRILRALRVLCFEGPLIDEPETIVMAANRAGIDPDELQQWMGTDEVEQVLREDMARAREPMPAARVLDDRLANWSGGRRYTCPSYEVERVSDGVRISVPGFQPFAAYDVLLANLVPDLGRRGEPMGVQEVLAWAGFPLATREVAEICELDDRDAREQLGHVAIEHHVGADGFWSLEA
ncbi:MAG TPA: DsbA family protein, partial [Thermoleophilaceae bacterium]|nr:DsbA family protein [Thermoleophilaceae bacterium]